MIKDFVKKGGALLISSWANITYLTSYSGFSQTERECFLLITKTKKYLVTDGRYSESIKKQTKGFEIIDIGAINFISEDYQNILSTLKSIAIEENNLTVWEIKKLKKFVKKINNIDLSEIRILKNKTEIKNIKKACKIGDLVFEEAIKHLKLRVTEKEIANRIEQIIISFGAEISFPPIVAFGKNSALPHHLSGNTKLKNNQIVLLDFGAKVNNYCSDMSRTLFFGNANDKFKKMHNAVLSAQEASIKFIKSELKNKKEVYTNDVDNEARGYILKNGYPNIPHSVGHGIGIEVHERPFISPKSNHQLIPNMVFSIEPGIYYPNFGGVRIEDLVLIKERSLELISRSRREIIEIDYV